MENEVLNKFCEERNIKLTALRKDILAILYLQKQPMGAYDLLRNLKKKRPNAEPPTVYRVLEYLMNVELVHRIESQNTYVCCSQLLNSKMPHKAILLCCKKCEKTEEFGDSYVLQAIEKFAEKYHVEVDDALIEIKGICQKCCKT
jgi:Fur family zinc uptake transcriptional regulator